jgi:hypothetical protein
MMIDALNKAGDWLSERPILSFFVSLFSSALSFVGTMAALLHFFPL